MKLDGRWAVQGGPAHRMVSAAVGGGREEGRGGGPGTGVLVKGAQGEHRKQASGCTRTCPSVRWAPGLAVLGRVLDPRSLTQHWGCADTVFFKDTVP